jgi:hypothetical protein
MDATDSTKQDAIEALAKQNAGNGVNEENPISSSSKNSPEMELKRDIRNTKKDYKSIYNSMIETRREYAAKIKALVPITAEMRVVRKDLFAENVTAEKLAEITKKIVELSQKV